MWNTNISKKIVVVVTFTLHCTRAQGTFKNKRKVFFLLTLLFLICIISYNLIIQITLSICYFIQLD